MVTKHIYTLHEEALNISQASYLATAFFYIVTWQCLNYTHTTVTGHSILSTPLLTYTIRSLSWLRSLNHKLLQWEVGNYHLGSYEHWCDCKVAEFIFGVDWNHAQCVGFWRFWIHYNNTVRYITIWGLRCLRVSSTSSYSPYLGNLLYFYNLTIPI